MKQNYSYSNNLKIIPMGGVDNVTKNMFIYEFGNDILVVDCGIGFPDEPSREEELLMPDFTYLKENSYKIKGLIVSHAHFDHYGAIPYLIEHIQCPIYTSRLTAEFIKKDIADSDKQVKHLDFKLISPKDNLLKIGAFSLTPFHINHSVPESLGLMIKTPIGNIFHVADYKFDWTPLNEDPFDVQKVSRLASESQPLLLLSDCLGAAKGGHTRSEASIQEVFENLMIRASGLVLVTTVSSNISRMKQAIKAAANVGRKTVFLGRSIEESSEIAKQLGYFSSLRQEIIPAQKMKTWSNNRLCLIVAGSYGQTDSALAEISKHKHRLVKLKKGDMVIFSADPSPPGVLVNVNKTIDNLTRLGVNVYYHEIQDNLHVSGHGTAEDMKMLIALVKPKYLLPIGGNYRHMFAYMQLALKMGYQENQILMPKEGQTLKFNYQKQLF